MRGRKRRAKPGAAEEAAGRGKPYVRGAPLGVVYGAQAGDGRRQRSRPGPRGSGVVGAAQRADAREVSDLRQQGLHRNQSIEN